MIQVKTRQQLTGNGFRQTLMESLRIGPNGAIKLSSFLVGFGPHLLTESVGRGVYFFAYESCKRNFVARNKEKDTPSLYLYQRMLSAAMAGIFGWTVIFPLDSLRSRLYGQLTANPKRSMEMIKFMYQENGIRGFYRGIGVTAVRAGPVAAVVLPIYDTVLEKLSASS